MHNFLEEVRMNFDKLVQEERKFLGDGKAHDWPDYKGRTGYIRGIRAAKSKLDEIVKNYIKEEEIHE